MPYSSSILSSASKKWRYGSSSPIARKNTGKVQANVCASSRMRRCALSPGPRSTMSSSAPCIISVTKPLNTPRAEKYSGWVKPIMLVWREPMESPAMARRSLLPPIRNLLSTKGITSFKSCGSKSIKSTMRRPSSVTVCTMPLHMTTANGTAFPSAMRLSRMNWSLPAVVQPVSFSP